MRMFAAIAAIFIVMVLVSGCTNTYNINSGRTSVLTDFKKTAGDTVFFDYDDAELSNHSKERLDLQIKWLNAHREVKAIIAGHCDERGTDDYNMALGERRAINVTHYLITHGIDSKRLDLVSYGKAKPAVVGHNEEAWKLNRRVVTSVITSNTK